MPFENLSPDVLLVGQRILGCSSRQLPQDKQSWEIHDELPHAQKPSEGGSKDLLQTDCLVEREIPKTSEGCTTRQGSIHHKSLIQADNLLLPLKCSGGMKGQRENSLNCFCQGRSFNLRIMASCNHSQTLLCKCLLCRRTSIFSNWTAKKPPLIFKWERKLEGMKIKEQKYCFNLQFLLACYDYQRSLERQWSSRHL